MKVCPVCSTEYGDDVKFCPNDGQTLRSAAPASDLVGQVIADSYHILQKLGEGGMGQVYLAQHVKMGRESAIKVMSPSMVHDPDAVARFNREAKNASQISHPNVCAIYDFGETPDGVIYLAMEYIKGEALTRIIEREGALPVARAVDLFLQVAEALHAAHDLGIAHRDLKPDNIMVVRARDGREVVKVVDFGIAKAVGGDEAGQKVTKTGLVVGTPEFMSPEQLSGDKVDGRSDLYSLALVFFQMLTGGLPFDADTVQEIMVKRLTDQPAKLADVRPDLSFPSGLQAAMDTALARLPAERYQQVTRFAADVAAVAGRGRGATAVPGTRPVDTEARTQVLSPGDARPTPGRTRTSVGARRAAGKRSLVPLVVGAVVVLGGAGAGMWFLGDRGTGGAAPDTATMAAGSPPATASNAQGTVPDTQRFATQGGTAPPTGGGGQENTVTPPVREGRTSPPPTVPRVDPAAAADALDLLQDEIDRDPIRARDSALVIYNAAAVSSTDKAMAAFIIANTYWKLQDRPKGCEWLTRARTLDPASPTYPRLEDQCQ